MQRECERAENIFLLQGRDQNKLVAWTRNPEDDQTRLKIPGGGKKLRHTTPAPRSLHDNLLISSRKCGEGGRPL